jgi:ketol-acid reductoisomerase
MRDVLQELRSGDEFARRLLAERSAGYPLLRSSREQAAEGSLEQARLLLPPTS